MSKFGGSYPAYDAKTMAKAVGTYLPISAKDSREISRAIVGKSVNSAIAYMEAVIAKKQAVPYRRYNWNTPHRRGKGFGAGRYPRRAGEYVLKLLKDLKANASDKTLNTDNLQLVHAAAQRGPVLWHYGRQRGRQRKCTHFEAVAAEIAKREPEPAEKAKAKPGKESPAGGSGAAKTAAAAKKVAKPKSAASEKASAAGTKTEEKQG